MRSGMDHIRALLVTAMGIWAVRAGFSRGPFYALGPGQRPKPDTKPLPVWWGRTWFLSFGCVLLYWAAPKLRGQWHWNELFGYWWVPVAFMAAIAVRLLVKRLVIWADGGSFFAKESHRGPRN